MPTGGKDVILIWIEAAISLEIKFSTENLSKYYIIPLRTVISLFHTGVATLSTANFTLNSLCSVIYIFAISWFIRKKNQFDFVRDNKGLLFDIFYFFKRRRMLAVQARKKLREVYYGEGVSTSNWFSK